jgi:hypothetical protein
MCESIKELSAAMAMAFAEITSADKDKKNDHLKYKYASLNSIIDAIKPAITKHGLWFYQKIHDVQGAISVETVIVHSSGETLSCGVIAVPVQKNDAQGYGSALTYARKYSLSASFGVAPDDDDDGQEACKPPKKTVEVAPKNPIIIEESPIVKDRLIDELVRVTGINEPEFMEILAKKQKICEDEGLSFCDELRKCIANSAETIALYTKHKAKTTFKKPVAKVEEVA